MHILYEEKLNHHAYEKNIGASVVYLNAVDNESTFPRNEHSNLLQKSTTVDAVSDSTANSTTSMSW